MAHCDKYVELISANLDGALSPAEQEKLAAHLSACSECQKLFDDLSALHAAMATLPPAEVPTDLKGRIMDAVAAEKVIPFAPKKSAVRWQRWLASAAVLALVVLGTWSWKPWEGNSPAADLPQTGSAVTGISRGRGADTTEAQPAAPAAMPLATGAPEVYGYSQNGSGDAGIDPAAPAPMPEAADEPTFDISAAELGQLSDHTDTAAPKSVSENGSDNLSPAEAAFTTETTGSLAVNSYTSKVAPAAGDTAMPRLYSIAPAAQSVQAPQAAPIPTSVEEGALEQPVTSQAEAVNVLANYIYEFVGDVELVEDDSAVSYAVNSPTGVSGIITCVGEDDLVYFLDYKDDLSPDAFHYSVNKQTSQVTLLEQVD